MYDKESLSDINARFLGAHFIRDSDVKLANEWSRIIECSRDHGKPVIGDIVRLTDKYGEYYGRAHIDAIDEDGNACVCERPYVPFICGSPEIPGFCFSTSGGAWRHCAVSRMKWIAMDLKRFCDWGSCGPCEDGAIEFEAAVNEWEYADPAPRFGEYTTRDWAKRCVSLREPADEYGYRYIVTSSEGLANTAFRTEDEYKAWLLTYKAVEFKGRWPNQLIVFLYKTEKHLIGEDEWNALPLPTDTRIMNASILTVKYRYDDEARTIHEYRSGNRGMEGLLHGSEYRSAMDEIRARGYERVIHLPVNE